MIHTLIVPGVGGSNDEHWQSWLQRQLMSCSRVQQQDWNRPILNNWVANFVDAIAPIQAPIQIVAHSFGCLTTVAALNLYPEINAKIKKLVLVAPANPSRFGEQGFAEDAVENYAAYFHQLNIKVPTEMLISENDPWLNFVDAQNLARSWNIKASNLGRVGHINVDSGFGAFPELYDYLISERNSAYISKIDETKLFFKFAI